MNTLLVLGLVIAFAQAQINTGTKTANDPNKKFITLPFLDEGQSNLLIGGALGAGATLLGQELLGGQNNPCPPGFGRKKRQAGDETNEKIFGLFGNNNNNCVPQQTNPCGRKKRQAQGVDKGGKVDTKFFGLFDGLLGGGNQNNPCYSGNFGQPQGSNQGYQQGSNQGYQQGFNQGYNNGFQNGASSNQGGFNQGGFNQGGSNQGGFNQGFNQGSNQVVRICQCTNYSKTDRYGNEEAKCARADHTGRKWCYSTSSSNCNDAQRSSKYQSNPWSYEACNNYNG